jgi:PAS domain S-box-containing protein
MKKNWFKKWFPPFDAEEDALTYWRERILFGLLFGGLAFSPIAVIPAVVLIIKHGLWMLAAVDTVALAALLYLLFSTRLSFFARSLGLIATFYAISLGVLTNAGIISGGPFWLFFVPILTSLLLGWRAAGMAVLLNAVTLAVVGCLVSRQVIGPPLPFFPTRESALSSLGNFVLLNAGATLVVSIMIRGLERVIRIQRETAEQLRDEIAERKRGTVALRQSERRYRQIFDNIQDVYYEASLDGIILEISPSIRKISKYAREELIGKSLYDIYTDPLQREAFIAALVRQRRIEDHEITLQDKDGSLHECSIVSSIVADEQDRYTTIVGSLRDITARKRIEAERQRLEAANLQLQKGESLGRMAGAVAHHFNNQFSVVMGNLEMAAENAPKGTPMREFLDEAMEGARRAAEISKAMLIYLGEDFSALTQLDLSEICRQHLPLLRAVLPPGVPLEPNLETRPLTVAANADQMQRVLMHLVSNASEAIDSGSGKLCLATGRIPAGEAPATRITPADWKPQTPYLACLSLSDNGHGIRGEDLDKIFDPFFTTRFVGRGLGLSVVLGIVKARDGVVAVESSPGRGTTFRIYLPLVET